MAGYKVLPHTADLKILIEAASLEELFARAGESLVSIIVDRRRVRKAGKKEAFVEGAGIEDLFFNFLRWVHFQFYGEGFLIRSINGKLERGECIYRPEAWGEPFHEGRHVLKTEIKAVTYHDLRVEKSAEGYMATFILDV
ncbi:MAG: hypothetical protein GTN70_07210 [Deltaproteobacteria bacterium]|nr:hypothetical protein [Deltaproteobacteria bacterium]NIS77484.1 hypothetical protein [Deltaproteobacteria bacterium]